MRRITKTLSVCLTLMLALATVAPAPALADSRETYSKESLSTSVLLSTSSVQTLGLPYLGDYSGNEEQIGFDTLYGLGNRQWTYNGETPGESYSKDYKSYTHGASTIDGRDRPWFSDPTKIDAGLSWDSKGTKDLHAANLKGADPFQVLADGLNNLLTNLTIGLNSIVIFPIDLLVKIVNIDITSLLQMLNYKALNDAMNAVFIGKGLSSPALMLAVVIFLLGLVAMVWKYMANGSQALSAIKGEIGAMILAMILVGVSASGAYTTIVSTLSSFSARAVDSINGNSGGSAALFSYQTGRSGEDSEKTLLGMVHKASVDAMIRGKLGLPSNELVLWDGTEETTQRNWNMSKADMQALVRDISGGDQNVFRVKTSRGEGEGTYTDADLGYWYYATLSGVDPTNPYGETNGRARAYAGNTDRLYYMADLLAGIDAKTGGSSKAQTLMRNIKGAGGASGGLIMVALSNIALFFALLFPAVFALFGKLLFNAGIVLIPAMPVLILIPSLRSYAKQILGTWITSVLKMILGQIIIYLIIFISATLSGSGGLGALINIVVMVVIAKQAPTFLSRLNQNLSSKFDQLEVARTVDQGFSRYANRVQGNHSALSNANALLNKRDQLNELKANALTKQAQYKDNFSNADKLQSDLDEYNNWRLWKNPDEKKGNDAQSDESSEPETSKIGEVVDFKTGKTVVEGVEMPVSDLPDHEDDSEILDPIHAGFSKTRAENLARTDADEKIIAGAKRLDETRDKLLERQDRFSDDVSKIRDALGANKIARGAGKAALTVAAMTPQGKVLADKILDLEAKRLQNIREDGLWQPVGAYYDFKTKRFDKKSGNIRFRDDNGKLHVGSALKIDRDIRDTDKKKWDEEVGAARDNHNEARHREAKYRARDAMKKNKENLKSHDGGKVEEKRETSKESADKAKDSLDKIKSGDKESSNSSTSNKGTSSGSRRLKFTSYDGGKNDDSPRR